ncbi:hypothetical protein CBL_01566 [Carabus blaptoides fortunei]
MFSALIAVLCVSQCIRAEKCGDNWEQVVTSMIGKLRLEKYRRLKESECKTCKNLLISCQELVKPLENV